MLQKRGVFYLPISPYCGKIMTRDLQLSVEDLQLYVREAKSISNLPKDILVDIFLRLPARSLLSCQCVCKRFSIVIRNSNFIATHVNRASTSSTTTSCSVFLCGRDEIDEWSSDEIYEDRYDHILLENTDRSVSFSYVRLSNPISCEISIVGSCNGLFCAELETPGDQNGSYFLIWNPVTRENRYVPKPKINASGITNTIALAFGCTPETNDYKVVRIVSNYSSSKPSQLLHDVVMNIEVFKMTTDDWSINEVTTLLYHEPDHVPPQVNPIILSHISFPSVTRSLKGAFHWLAVKAIVSFDLKEEQLKLFTVLDPHKIPNVELGILDVLNDSLSLVVPHIMSPNSSFDVWVMNDYGNRLSWTKQFTVEQFHGFARPVGYWKDDLFLMAKMLMGNRYLFFYNLKTQEMKIFPVMWYFYSATFCDYVETLETVSRGNAGESVQ